MREKTLCNKLEKLVAELHGKFLYRHHLICELDKEIKNTTDEIKKNELIDDLHTKIQEIDEIQNEMSKIQTDVKKYIDAKKVINSIEDNWGLNENKWR